MALDCPHQKINPSRTPQATGSRTRKIEAKGEDGTIYGMTGSIIGDLRAVDLKIKTLVRAARASAAYTHA
jgi:hypothetical protein